MLTLLRGKVKNNQFLLTCNGSRYGEHTSVGSCQYTKMQLGSLFGGQVNSGPTDFTENVEKMHSRYQDLEKVFE
jgi:hypothetical protein